MFLKNKTTVTLSLSQVGVKFPRYKDLLYVWSAGLLSYISDENLNVHFIDYKLIGILTEFRKEKYYCLIANKIHLILEALAVIEGYEFK